MADLITVQTFIDNADEHAEFLKRVRVALYEVAITTREGQAASLDEQQTAEQNYALRVFADPVAEAKRMLPALAIKANDNGLIDAQGAITATDTQVRNTVAALFTEFSQYVAPAAP